jgi:hypothetical protein
MKVTNSEHNEKYKQGKALTYWAEISYEHASISSIKVFRGEYVFACVCDAIMSDICLLCRTPHQCIFLKIQENKILREMSISGL